MTWCVETRHGDAGEHVLDNTGEDNDTMESDTGGEDHMMTYCC